MRDDATDQPSFPTPIMHGLLLADPFMFFIIHSIDDQFTQN